MIFGQASTCLLPGWWPEVTKTTVHVHGEEDGDRGVLGFAVVLLSG